jgi:ABC-type antimicrobial peptide transport system permease subunit
MGIGFGAILFLVSLGYGLQEALLQNIASSGALAALDVAPNEQERKILVPETIEKMRNIDGVEGVETSFDFKAKLKFGDTESDTRAEIATPGYISLENLKYAAGPAGGKKEKPLGESGSKSILVSAALAKIFGKTAEEMIGQKISFSLSVPANGSTSDIGASGYEITGVTDGEETIMYAAPDGLGIPESAAFSKAKVRCKSAEALASVRDVISNEGFSVTSLTETVNEISKLFRGVNIVLGLFGIITLFVSSIGMFNTMTVALLERTTEIGIMRSIGASRADIFFMFIIESTLMGFAGGTAGIVLGIAAGQLVNLAINIAAGFWGGKPLDIFAYPLWFLEVILAFSVFIGFATGIGPARRASKLDPLEALRSR